MNARPGIAVTTRRRSSLHLLVGIVSLLVLGCPTADTQREPILVLISLDGFRADYLERLAPENLSALADDGVRGSALVSSFPTKTFPNHYTIVTGLYPAHHGIVSNNIYDPELDARFGLGLREEVQRSDWWLGEPIWVSAERQGIRTAPLFWPGSEAEIKGVRPTHWLPYDDDLSAADRLQLFFEWVDSEDEQRPRFYTLYFSDTDGAGHRHGPESEELRQAVERVDRYLGDVVRGLAERNQPANLIIVSDHGMSATVPERVVLLDELVDLEGLDVVDLDPGAMIRVATEKQLTPDERETRVRQVITALDQHPNITAYHRDELPVELHYTGSPRIPEIIAIADDGWRMTRRERFERNPESFRGGAHGYPPSDRSMDALFVGNGPGFVSGVVAPAFENIHLYELMAALLKIEPAPNDGRPDVTAGFLRGDR